MNEAVGPHGEMSLCRHMGTDVGQSGSREGRGVRERGYDGKHLVQELCYVGKLGYSSWEFGELHQGDFKGLTQILQNQ